LILFQLIIKKGIGIFGLQENLIFTSVHKLYLNEACPKLNLNKFNELTNPWWETHIVKLELFRGIKFWAFFGQ